MLEKPIVKRGDSLYVLLPKEILDMLGLEEKDKLKIEVVNGKIILTPKEKNVNQFVD